MIDEILEPGLENPILLLLGLAGGGLAFWVSGFYEGGMFWRIASAVVSTVAAYFVAVKMSSG